MLQDFEINEFHFDEMVVDLLDETIDIQNMDAPNYLKRKVLVDIEVKQLLVQEQSNFLELEFHLIFFIVKRTIILKNKKLIKMKILITNNKIKYKIITLI